METNTELKMIHLSEIESQQIKWLWYPFIPYGKLSIVQGDPGDGKSTLILNIAAKLSMGECIDENMNITEPVNVCLLYTSPSPRDRSVSRMPSSA